jgi:hypothetical protein
MHSPREKSAITLNKCIESQNNYSHNVPVSKCATHNHLGLIEYEVLSIMPAMSQKRV